MPLSSTQGITRGDGVSSSAALQFVPVGRQMTGRVFDGLGRPIDDAGPLTCEAHYPVLSDAPAPLARGRIERPLATGIRSIDALNTVGKGQRVGMFAGTGVGKSVLMGMIARNTSSDVTVVALVGERGREVGDFIRKDLGEEGLRKTVMVVSTSDESPVLRVRACFVATAIAEYFRDQGADVLLLMDSVTRMAMAQRQIGLAAGEPPATKGYTPSVFALLPQLLERAGKTSRGSITGLYTVLVEGDDITEPVSDAVRGTLDGHVWLARKLANHGHYPAVAPLESISRVMPDIVDAEHMEAARQIRAVLAVWEDIEDLVNIGAYAAGANADYDVAVKMKPEIDAFLRQGTHDRSSIGDARERLIELTGRIRALRDKLQQGMRPEVAAAPGGSR
jgi:flagellum-specific ATP synthase